MEIFELKTIDGDIIRFTSEDDPQKHPHPIIKIEKIIKSELSDPGIKTAVGKKYGIWEYFNEQHNLQLLESEIDEIVRLALKDDYASQFQEQPITVTDELEKAITEFDLTDLFDDLEKHAYNEEYHNYNCKQTNQIIRKHFEALSLKAQKPRDDIENKAPYSSGQYIKGENDVDYYRDEDGSVSYA